MSAPSTPRSELILEQVARLVRAAFYVCDAAGCVIYCNDRIAEIWGRRPGASVESAGEMWRAVRFLGPGGSAHAYDETPLARVFREGTSVRDAPLMIEMRDGTRAMLEVTVDPVRGEHLELLGSINVLHDVTERTRLEHGLHEARTELRAALAVKEEFLGQVSHELRTPVTTILGNARLLERVETNIDPDTRSQMLADVCQEATRLHRTVEDLLVLVQVESNRLEREPLVLSRVVSQAVRDHGASSDHVIELDGDGRSAIVLGDERAIRQLLRNYLNNAEKYSPAPATTNVQIEEAGGEVLVRLLDRGIGLDPAEADLLFEPFATSKSAWNTGIGAGLAVCRRLAEAMDGRVWAVPRPGGGSEFGFALPRYEDEVGSP